MPARPLWLSTALLLATIAAGLAVRFAHLGLPFPIVKYGGSAFWALEIYWGVTTLLPSCRLPLAVMLAGILATAIEFLKLWHAPVIEAVRPTLPGVLILGRYFSGWDILAYWAAIIAGSFMDHAIRPVPRANRE